MRSENSVREYHLYRVADFLSRVLPRGFAYWVSLRSADAFFRRDARGRAAVMANLRQVLRHTGRPHDDAAVRLMARRTFQHFGKFLVDFFTFSRMNAAQVRELVAVEGDEYLETLARAKRGVIAVTGHVGNWELGGAVFAAMGHPINAVALRHDQQKLDSLFRRYRRRRGIQTIPLGNAVWDLTRALRRNQCVALLADRDYERHHDYVSFFGAPACLPRGPAWLGARLGVPVIPAFVLREKNDTFRMRIHPPLNEDGAMSQGELQQAIVAALESAIAAEPCQWFMFEEVWGGRTYGEEAGETAGNGGVA